MNSQYYLPDDVHVCACGTIYIILDAVNDRYLCLTSDQSYLFAQLAAADGHVPTFSKAGQLANRLADQGILTPRHAAGHPIAHRTFPAAAYSITDRHPVSRPLPHWKHTPHLMLAIAICLALRKAGRRHIARCVHAARTWKAGIPGNSDTSRDQVLALTESFHALTPYFFTTQDACFFRSLVLLRFLSSFNISAEWVFGVRLAPFDAHCWVSHRGILLNETCDKAAEYQPIMVV
ncbi:lasso peptide biosynthesis B2 protein [Henriciella sp.]|uniref:lasso peptide biosynthesis B2 protein n=1 Tax=Henriciella sp. TaxID=1968823 RepID=UPI002602D0DB|nr:lasso peptide biosynthesis B2 protein [Henriciella sp.]